MILHGKDHAPSCVHYWTPTEAQLEEAGFETYEPIEHVFAAHILGLIKKPKPSFCNVPSVHPEVIAQQERYFDVSNREDLMVLEMEREAFMGYYLKEKKEIEKALAVKY